MIPGMAGFPGRQSQSMLMILPFLGHRVVSAAQGARFSPNRYAWHSLSITTLASGIFPFE